MPEMKAMSFRDFDARTPTCHSFFQPGALRALSKNQLPRFDSDRMKRAYQLKKV
jgi:hypothetical protein